MFKNAGKMVICTIMILGAVHFADFKNKASAYVVVSLIPSGNVREVSQNINNQLQYVGSSILDGLKSAYHYVANALVNSRNTNTQ